MSSPVNPDDLRLGDVITKGEKGDVVLVRRPRYRHCDDLSPPPQLGFPYEEGVRRNGGRIGAAAGPATLRKYADPHLIGS